MPNEKYKYLRQDFGELPVQLEHLDIYLNFVDDTVEAVNCPFVPVLAVATLTPSFKTRLARVC